MGLDGARQLERFGKYQLLERIGVGGMAEVFWAKTHGAQGFVKELVIKRILPALSADPEFVKMFINEAHIAARLHHANIVQIFDFDHVEGVYYIAMEWVDGVDLRKIQATAARRRMPVPLNVAIHIGVEVLKGLHYAHSRIEHGEQLQLVHRDISPHNLLVSFAGEVKIADFGIAKIAAVASTRTGTIKGKLAYMSPEQVNGVPVDASTDIFALGVVLWEMVANRRLYPATTDAELLSAVGRAEIPPVSSVNPEVEPSIDAIIARMVARDQADRYRTATEALADLSELGAVAEELLVADYLRALLPAEAEREQMDQTAIDDSPGYCEASPAAPTKTRSSQGLQRAECEVDDEAETKEVSGPVAEVLATAPTLLKTNPGVDPHPESAITRIPVDETHDASPQVRQPLLIALVVAVPLFALAGWFLGGVTSQDKPPQRAVVMPSDATIFINGDRAAQGNHPPLDGAAIGSTRGDDAAIGSNQEPQSRPVGKQRPNIRPIQPSRARTMRGEGTINIVVSPWAKVRIDGVSVGITPVLSRQLRVGRHLVELQNAALRRRERVRIRILANKKMTIRRDWTK